MRNSLQDLKLMLVYVLEFIIEGQQRSVVLRPIDAGNGVVLEETSEDSGIMRGKLMSGGMLEVPVAAITNVFPQWWKKTDRESGQGVKNWWVDDEVIEKHATRDVGKADKWDEHGCHKDIEGTDSLPKDVRNSRIVRGDGEKKWWE